MCFRRLIFLVLINLLNYCDGVTNAVFNEQIRDYSVSNDRGLNPRPLLPNTYQQFLENLTNVQTLQKDGIGLARYASFAPLQNTVRFKEVPDNVLSGSSHPRGLLHHDNGYGLYEYEDPHYGHGYEHGFEHGYEHDHNPHHYNHHEFHDDHHVAHHGYHHKHYDHHALAAKTILWPIAGIALLGAAAALVTNPVLLQLGVVSGRKKRHVESLDLVKDSIKKWTPNPIKINQTFHNIPEFMLKRRTIKNNNAGQVEERNGHDELEHKSDYRILKVLSKRYMDEDEEKMIPVPLRYKESMNNIVDNDYGD